MLRHVVQPQSVPPSSGEDAEHHAIADLEGLVDGVLSVGKRGYIISPMPATMIVEMPFSPFSELVIKPIVDGPTGWSQAREAFAAILVSS